MTNTLNIQKKRNHPRMQTYTFKICKDNCPDGSNPVKIIIFKDDAFLHSHAVKHLTDEYEIETWKGLFPTITKENVLECRNKLIDMGCRLLMLKPEIPPCFCGLHSECSRVLKHIVEEYGKIIDTLINEGSTIPRYACRVDQKDKLLWIMPDQKIYVKAYLLESKIYKGIYNIATAYNPKDCGTWQEVRDYVRKKIKVEKKSAILCEEIYWQPGFNNALADALQKALDDFKKR